MELEKLGEDQEAVRKRFINGLVKAVVATTPLESDLL